MNIHDHAPVVGHLVRDHAGRRVGRIVAVDYAATGHSEAWYLVRLTGSRGRFRGVPATATRWASASRGIRAVVVLDLGRELVWGSPSLSWRARRAGVCRDAFAAYYGDPAAAART
jgi:hypothetical protein